MQRILVTYLALLLSIIALAQSPKEEFRKNLHLTGSNFLAYPYPKTTPLTPAPQGKRPFYISHYGRHGSRYQTNAIDYDYAYDVMLRADGEGALSPLGCDVLRRLAEVRKEGRSHLGELTQLGARQSRDIASRMYERFPEVFQGSVVVNARSTTTPRCILSMSCALTELQKHNSKLQIQQDASDQYNYYLKNFIDPVSSDAAVDAYRDFCNRHQCWQRVVDALFSDKDYLEQYVNGERLNYYLFRLASGMQNTEQGNSITFYDLFTDDEIYEDWLCENAFWFLGYGFSVLTGNERPYSQTMLLRTIIEQADSCLRLPAPGATLRFGHETILLPFICLLNIIGFGETIDDLNQLVRKGWLCYRAVPMGANVQFVFYRSDSSDQDVLFKVLLNENEATLPLPSQQAPYYRWSDFRDYYLKLLTEHEGN